MSVITNIRRRTVFAINKLPQNHLINRGLDGFGKVAKIVTFNKYCTGLTREAYRLYQKTSSGETVEVRNDGFYLDEEKIAGNNDISSKIFSYNPVFEFLRKEEDTPESIAESFRYAFLSSKEFPRGIKNYFYFRSSDNEIRELTEEMLYVDRQLGIEGTNSLPIVSKTFANIYYFPTPFLLLAGIVTGKIFFPSQGQLFGWGAIGLGVFVNYLLYIRAAGIIIPGIKGIHTILGLKRALFMNPNYPIAGKKYIVRHERIHDLRHQKKIKEDAIAEAVNFLVLREKGLHLRWKEKDAINKLLDEGNIKEALDLVGRKGKLYRKRKLFEALCGTYEFGYGVGYIGAWLEEQKDDPDISWKFVRAVGDGMSLHEAYEEVISSSSRPEEGKG